MDERGEVRVHALSNRNGVIIGERRLVNVVIHDVTAHSSPPPPAPLFPLFPVSSVRLPARARTIYVGDRVASRVKYDRPHLPPFVGSLIKQSST